VVTGTFGRALGSTIGRKSPIGLATGKVERLGVHSVKLMGTTSELVAGSTAVVESIQFAVYLIADFGLENSSRP
jgi:hypothetical protein